MRTLRTTMTRTGLALVTMLAALAVGAPSASAQAAPAGSTVYTSVAPERLADTRTGFGVTRLDANTIRVQVTGRFGVPTNATAAVLNVTTTNTTAWGYVSVYPSGDPLPNASNLNYEAPGQTVPNLVTVKLGVGGAVNVYTSSPADLIVDVSGAYVPTASARADGRFVGLSTSQRALDTRSARNPVAGNTVRNVPLSGAGVPPSASAVVLNMTVDGAVGPGFWTAYPNGQARPNSSNLNIFQVGQTTAAMAIVKLSGGAPSINVYAEGTTGGSLIVDVIGYFTGAGDAVATDGMFIPVNPTAQPPRRLDTRQPGSYGRTFAGWTAEFSAHPGVTAGAAVINLTTDNARGVGYLTAYAARTPLPNTSNLNTIRIGQTIANHAIVRLSGTGVAVFASVGGHIIADVAGYYTGQPITGNQPGPRNVVPTPSPLPYRIDAPSIGLTNTIYEGVSDSIVDRGVIGHWPGTGLAGENSHMVLFGHRTEAGAPLYWIHLLEIGDLITVTGADGKVHTYQVARYNITGPTATNILDEAYSVTEPSISLVACTRRNGLPTSLAYRYIVTAVLIS